MRQAWITRADLQANPDRVYLFGDNLLRIGMGGQAGAMRGEPNAIGVATKKAPGMADRDFFTDAEYSANCAQIDHDLTRAFEAKTRGRVIVIPSDGLGTGLSEMPTRCPRTLEYLNGRLAELEDVK